MPQWDADVYLRFGNERTQPVLDLLHRIQIENPARIIDLGCGPGNSTAELRRRWPKSETVGLDSSREMIDKARQAFPEGRWELGDVSAWQAQQPFDLVFSNALLQWVPDHARLCPHLFRQVAPGGALAAQAPAHYDSPLHREIIDVSHDPRWTDRMSGARQAMTKESPSFYYDLLQADASRVDVWETIYYHVLSGPEAVLEWFRGTGLRPFFEALSSAEERRRFESLLLERYATAYPRRAGGNILFPFRRLFFVAYR